MIFYIFAEKTNNVPHRFSLKMVVNTSIKSYIAIYRIYELR